MSQTLQKIFEGLTTFDLLLLASFTVLYLFRFMYLVLFTGRILFQKKKISNEVESKPFSLIMTIRNQENNLKNNLPKILSVEKPDFEVVVVDDYSQDNSFLVLGLLKEKYKRLKISILNQETRFSMKLAQNIALKAARFDWVITTPITMSNVNPEWLPTMSKLLVDEKKFVLAYSSYEYSKGFFNHLSRIENYFQYQKSVGFILNRMAFVYNEENVAFQKNIYFEKGGYGYKKTEPFANLELFVNLYIRKKTTLILFNKAASIQKRERMNGADFMDLLKKSIRIEKHLSFSKKALLAFEEITKLLFLPGAVVVIVLYPELWALFVGLLGTKILAHLVIIKILQNRLNERKIFISSLVYDFVMPYFKLFHRWYFDRQSKKNRWRSKS